MVDGVWPAAYPAVLYLEAHARLPPRTPVHGNIARHSGDSEQRFKPQIAARAPEYRTLSVLGDARDIRADRPCPAGDGTALHPAAALPPGGRPGPGRAR